MLARRGEFDAAERLAREAVAIAEKSDFLFAHGEALTDLAEVLELSGQRDAAASAAGASAGFHERKGNVFSAT